MDLNIAPDSPFADPEFTIGVATSSFQIEGDAENREKNIWDTFCQQPGAIDDGSDGLVACEHVKHWREDLDIVASLGVDAYRFSVSWPRVMRADGSVNERGLAFYVDLLDRLNEQGIKPYVTLYHWDLPQTLEDKGGWLNRQTAYEFARYAEVVCQAFKGKVFSYATLNEPFCSAYLGYEIGMHAPGKTGKEYGKKAIHHLLLAHGLAMQVLERISPETENGIVLNFSPVYPATDLSADINAAHVRHIHSNDWYIRPLVEGTYPSLIDSLPQEHRPHIEPGDMEIIAHPIDYLGVNYYTRAICKAGDEGEPEELSPPPGSALTSMGWEIYPQGLTDLLVQLHEDFTLPPMIVTENGLASDDYCIDGQVKDELRISYLQTHINAVEAAMAAGVNITGYFVWSLMDNFEWSYGYEKRFGIVYVDYETQQRTLKDSALAVQKMLKNRK